MVIKNRYRKFLKLFIKDICLIKDDAWESLIGGSGYFYIKKADGNLVLVAFYRPRKINKRDKYIYNKLSISIGYCVQLLLNHGLRQRIESYDT